MPKPGAANADRKSALAAPEFKSAKKFEAKKPVRERYQVTPSQKIRIMSKETAIKLFEQKQVCSVWNDEEEK